MTKHTARILVLDLLRRSRLRVQMAAVISDAKGRIISWGWNHGYVHAEEHAISRANPARLSGSTITIAGRRSKSGNLVHARPCERPGKHCLKLIRSRDIIYIEYLSKAGTWERTT